MAFENTCIWSKVYVKTIDSCHCQPSEVVKFIWLLYNFENKWHEVRVTSAAHIINSTDYGMPNAIIINRTKPTTWVNTLKTVSVLIKAQGQAVAGNLLELSSGAIYR